MQSLIHLAGEAVDEELSLATAVLGVARDMLRHGVLQQLHRHLHRHDSAITDVVADQPAELRPRPGLLGAQQVARRQVREAVVGHQSLTLRALAGAGPAEHEEDRHVVVVGRERRLALVLGRRRELARRLRRGEAGHVGCTPAD